MKIYEGAPLSRYGYWRVGGPMQRFCLVESPQELEEIGPIQHVLGNGSNLLVPDEGLAGTTIRLGGSFLALNLEDGPASSVTISAGGGLLNTVLLQRLAGQGIAGLGCLAGVPGTVGGAVVMNAGTALGEVSSVLLSVEGADGQRLDRADLAMEYREGGLPPGFIVTAARFRGNRDGFAAERERVASHLARRTATQPLNLPSCGSVFRNPPGAHAGALIERVGLKGWRSGQAQVSDKHANFIVNLGGATSLDVMRCIRQAWSTVRLETGICLIPEVRVLGDWPPELWPLPAA